MIRKRLLIKSLFATISHTNWIIFINVLCFLIFTILLAINADFLNYIELNPLLFVEKGYYWTAITSMFMHQGGFHLFVNMISLFFLGNLCEKIIGKKRFLGIYFLSGIVGALAFVAGAYLGSAFGAESVFGSIEDFAAGASGAIFGLVGLLAILVPNFKVFLIAGPIVLIILEVLITPFLPASIAGILSFVFSILILISIFGMFSQRGILRKLAWPIEMPFWVAPIAAIVPLVLISIFIRLPIGNTAHLGGLIIGIIYGAILRMKYPKKVQLLQRMFKR